MEKKVELETVLSATIGVNFTNNFGEVFKLAWFVFNDSYINDTGLHARAEELKNHLLSLHPQLREISYNEKTDKLCDWIISKKLRYGDSLPICQIGHKLGEGGKIRQLVRKITKF